MMHVASHSQHDVLPYNSMHLGCMLATRTSFPLEAAISQHHLLRQAWTSVRILVQILKVSQSAVILALL